MSTYIDPATALRIARQARMQDIQAAEAHRAARMFRDDQRRSAPRTPTQAAAPRPRWASYFTRWHHTPVAP
jgi:hypothetical protein